MGLTAEPENPECPVPPSLDLPDRQGHKESAGCHPKSGTRIASKVWAVTPPPSVRPSSYSCSAPHLTAHSVFIPRRPLGSYAKNQILLFPTTSRPTPPGHAIAHLAVYRLSLEKLSKIPQNRPREGGTGCLSRRSGPQSSRLPGPCLQSSQQGQISSLKVRAAPAWQAVPSQRGLGLPRVCSAQDTALFYLSGCGKAVASAEPTLVLPLVPRLQPQQGNALPSASPVPCSSAQEKKWSRARVTDRGVSSHPQIPGTRLMPSGVHHTASCTSTNPVWGSAPVQRTRLGHHHVSPGPTPSSSTPAASTPCQPEPWPRGISRASADKEDPGVLRPFIK